MFLADGYFFLLHRLKQCCLGFGRCPVYLVCEHDIAENWAMYKPKEPFI